MVHFSDGKISDMKVITSRDNPIYREVVRLLRKKYRDETGNYLVEGIKPLMDALNMGLSFERIFVREGSDTGMTGLPRDALTGLSAGLFDRLSDTENSQGVIAVAKRRDMDMERFLHESDEGNILIMDRLQDPGNVGTVIRTAEAAGAAGIIAMKGTVDVYSPKVVRAAAGSLHRMPVLVGLSEDQLSELIGAGGWKLAVTSVENGEDCFDVSVEDKVALVIGSEGAGVSEELISRADIRLMIPMEGNIESLNAAVAAGILMYQLRRNDQRRKHAGKTQ